MLSPFRKSVSLPLLSALPFLALLAGCSAPRSILWDGRVAEAGSFEIQADQVVSLPSASLGPYFDVLDKAKSDLSGLDRSDLRKLERALVAAQLDMPGTALDMGVRVGVGAGFELGGRYVAGSKGGDLRWQFLDGGSGEWTGGVGLGYMTQSFEVSGKAGTALGMDFKRQDLLIPLAFGVQYGSAKGFHTNLGCGAGVALTQVDYSFSPVSDVQVDGTVKRAEVIPETQERFASFGVHGMVQPGWGVVNLTLGASLWHTDYGTYKVPDMDPISLEGWSFLPSVGLALRF